MKKLYIIIGLVFLIVLGSVFVMAKDYKRTLVKTTNTLDVYKVINKTDGGLIETKWYEAEVREPTSLAEIGKIMLINKKSIK